MQIVIVSADKETATLSLVDAKRRLEESRAIAAAQNERMFEAILNLDPDEGGVDDRVAAQEKIYECERDAELAWKRYEKALTRYGWEVTQARKVGVIE
jgi:hypothetical protein